MKIVFMGTPEFAVPTLASLLASRHEVVAVYSQPPKPAGRGQKLQPSPVHLLAESHAIPVYTPVSLKTPEVQAEFRAHGADAAVVAAYGLLLPEPILNAYPYGCINVHPSLLPRWRGAAPIQRTIMAGDNETGVTIMQMDKGLDTGAMLLVNRMHLQEKTTASQLHDNLAEIAGPMVLTVLDALERGSIAATPQPEEGVTYAQKLTKEERVIDWSSSAVEIDRKIRGLTPWPGVTFTYKGEVIKLLSAEVTAARGTPGEVLDEQLTIACGEGSVRLLTLQRAGKSAMDVESFLRGFPVPKGEKLA